METKETNRRGFIDKILKSSALVGIAGLLYPNKIVAKEREIIAANNYAMWIHGSEGKMEGVFHSGKDSIKIATKMINKMRNFHSAGYARSIVGRGMSGHSISLGGEAAATAIPTSGGAQITIWDSGSKSKAKNGEFWIHYSIPTPVIANNVRVRISNILVKCASTDANFYISDIELWDANKRIFNRNNQKIWGPDKMHSFSFRSNPKKIFYGLCLSLKIKGERVSADRIFEISGVGVDLMA
ncbi:hypothetical protein EGM88_04750 [Aureibaculum marinum]|uniref:Uncharacterized protein n=1 Tax=Aureibaculum marinum TaxID=2487930 RepID=A0A3N4NQK0_9FLAO|nr:DUF6623 family protein [Aureibaculum marinum]RPD98514.1 hypothetical protein EGM88_04750 [Aureibaculum marinum]